MEPEHVGPGVRPLAGVDEGAGRVGDAGNEHEGESDPAQAAEQLRGHDERAPSHHHVGDGDGPLGRIEPDLAQHDAGDRARPDQAEHERLRPARQGQPGHRGRRPGDADEDGAVVGPPHAAPGRRRPADAMEDGADPEHGQHGEHVDGQRRLAPRVGAGRDEEGAADEPGHEGRHVDPPPQQRSPPQVVAGGPRRGPAAGVTFGRTGGVHNTRRRHRRPASPACSSWSAVSTSSRLMPSRNRIASR